MNEPTEKLSQRELLHIGHLVAIARQIEKEYSETDSLDLRTYMLRTAAKIVISITNCYPFEMVGNHLDIMFISISFAHLVLAQVQLDEEAGL